MKKRIFIGFLALVFSLGTIFALSACGTNAAAGSPLQTEKKYINEESVAAASDKQSYYLFHGDNTGIYRYYAFYESYGTTRIYDYTVTFKYEFVDRQKEAVVCLYDSVEYGDTHNQNEISSTWSVLLTVSHMFCARQAAADMPFIFMRSIFPRFPISGNRYSEKQEAVGGPSASFFSVCFQSSALHGVRGMHGRTFGGQRTVC